MRCFLSEERRARLVVLTSVYFRRLRIGSAAAVQSRNCSLPRPARGMLRVWEPVGDREQLAGPQGRPNFGRSPVIPEAGQPRSLRCRWYFMQIFSLTSCAILRQDLAKSIILFNGSRKSHHHHSSIHILLRSRIACTSPAIYAR